MKKTTSWHHYSEDGVHYRMKVEYGIDYAFSRRHNQDPYFTMTGLIEYQVWDGRWMEEFSGQINEETLRRVFPALVPYHKWQNVGPHGPYHYLANAKYWFKLARGDSMPGAPEQRSVDPVEAFKHTIVLGAFPGDVMRLWRGPKEWSPRGPTRKDIFSVQWLDVVEWLEARLPKLVAAWVVDMGELGVLEE